MAISPNPLQRDRVLVQAQDTGDRLTVGNSNAALQLASSLKDLEPTLATTLDGLAQEAADKQHAAGKRAALIGQGQTLADAVRAGKIKPTQNPWFMEAYSKESAALSAQSQFTALQMDSTTWAEKNDPVAFAQKWNDGVSKIAQGYTDKDAISGFAPVEAQFTQQALQSNAAENQSRILNERKQNVSSLAAQALVQAASKNGGTLSASDAIATLAPSKDMWMHTGGSEADWNALQLQAITTAAYSSMNPGLLDLSKAIGVDGSTVLDGHFGAGPDPQPQAPTVASPAPALASHALPEQFRLPVPGPAKVTSPFGQRRPDGEVHNGLDLAVPEGTPVTSPGAGRVVEVSHDPRSGNFVKVDYGNGVVSSFAHLSAQSVQVGDRVAPGAILGQAGSTGHSTGPHVHWVVRVNGQAVNPQSVKFPQGAVADAAQQAAAPAAPPAVPGTEAPPPPPQIAKGPSLYDIAGAADGLEKDRYDITRAQEDGVLNKLRVEKAKIAVQSQAATDYLYQAHGTDILLGNYKTPDLVKELAAQGFSGPVIQETLKDFSEATNATASLQNNRMRINSADPVQAKAIMDLEVEGRRDGFSPGYEQKVGHAVLNGDITGDDGARMVSNAITRSQSLEAEARADKRAAITAANADPTAINNYTKLRQHAGDLTALAGTLYQKLRGRPPIDAERQKVKGIVTDAIGAYLTAHPGDFDGAYNAGRQAVADYAKRLGARVPKAASSSTSANPRGQ